MQQMKVFIAAGCLFVLSCLLMSQTQKPKKPAASSQAKSPVQASITRGQQVYADQCLTCHQADGGGVQNMNPPLIKTKWVLGDKSQLIQIVLKGMTGDIEIDGNSYHNVMPGHEYLTDQQIADVLTYIRNSFGNKAKAVTVAEVKAVRAKTK